jgi:hypothetical protein
MTPAAIAWSATLFCVVFSARMADGFLRANPRLFTVMALFACNWALLLPYYGMPAHVPRPELLSSLGGFLSIYAGGLLMLHAHQPHAPAPDVVTWQVIGVNLLLLVAVESALAIPGPQGAHLFRPSSPSGSCSSSPGSWQSPRESGILPARWRPA